MIPRRCPQKRREGAGGTPVIVEVRNGSPCGADVQAGDVLLEIDGRQPLDILDYLQAGEAGSVSLRLLRDGVEVRVKVSKDTGTPLGLVFEEPVFDGIRTCRNHCIFCFVDQMPRGLRPSLYLKDDDYRLSFYYGNFVTLNNLTRGDMKRILKLRLSPLYVSLHAVDASLRSLLMGGDVRRGLEALRVLLDAGLQIHLQVVSCPGINDGAGLHDTLRGVLEDYPAASLGVVPVGLTSLSYRLPRELRPHDESTARGVIETVERYRKEALERYGRRMFHAADEFYLLAGMEFPGEDEYDGYPQLENGVGMARKLIQESSEEAGREPPHCGETVSPSRGIITGVAGKTVIEKALRGAGLGGVEVLAVENRLLGRRITVTALLGGEDIMAFLEDRRPTSRELFMPESMLRDGAFIDDVTPSEIEKETSYRLSPLDVDGALLVRSLRTTGG